MRSCWTVVGYSKHGKKVKKLRLFQTFASLVIMTISGHTCAVWILQKNITCACSGLSGWRQWPWNTHSMSADSLISSLLPLWRIQGMLCIESVNSLVCHAGRLRSTVLMTSFKIVHISPSKRVAWSSKQPKVLHITSYFLAIMPPMTRQKQTLSAFTSYRYVVIIDSWSLVTHF